MSAFDVDIVAKSAIKTSCVEIAHAPQTDWIFFTSPRSLECFAKQHQLSNYKLAALSSGTAQAVSAMGAQADFIGKGNDTEAIARDFLIVLGNKKVFFPISNRSLGKVHTQIPKNQRIVEVAYTTNNINSELPENCEIAVFTSPSNAESFIHCANKLAQKHIVCIGKSTLEYVKKHFSKSIHHLSLGFDEEAISQVVLSILNEY